MSDDLISRKALEEKFMNQYRVVAKNDYDIEWNMAVNDSINVLREIHTDYDIDLVCDEIHKVFHEELDAIFEKSDREVIAEKNDWILKMNKKINEIVRNGGKKERMTERQYERRDIILGLIGSITGDGETNHDKEVLKNLDFAEEIITHIVEDLICNTAYTGYEASMLEIKEKSRKILDYVSEVARQED